MFLIGLTTARELPGREVAEALATELAGSSPQRAVLLLIALADSQSPVLPPAVVEAMKTGPTQQVRIAAIDAVGKLGDAASLPALLEIAADADADVAQAARSALAGLPGEKVNAEIVARLPKAQGQTFAVLIELVGQRRIDADAGAGQGTRSRRPGHSQCRPDRVGRNGQSGATAGVDCRGCHAQECR